MRFWTVALFVSACGRLLPEGGATPERAAPQASCVSGPDGPAPVVQLAVGGEHTCTLDEWGNVCCWGANEVGQLGDGTRLSRPEPARVPGLPAARLVAAGGGTTCAALADGSVRCWGHNAQGQLGDGTRIDRPTPVAVQGLHRVVRLSVGPTRVCAVLEWSDSKDGPLRCWGDLVDGSPQLGSAAPVAVPMRDTIVDLVTGGDSRLLLGAGAVLRIRRIVSPPSVTVPDVEWPGGDPEAPRLTQLATSCAVGKDASLLDCRAFSGELLAMRGVAQVSTCSDRGCAAMLDGSVRCWGDNERGELGFESPPNCEHSAKLGSRARRCATVPGLVPGVTAAVQVAVGDHHACALQGGGTVTCWGVLPPAR